jgi:non-specific serine/threonine protein kinase/serine/threonine-protein kinase
MAETLAGLGLCLTRLGRGAEAEPLLRQCLAIREKNAPDAWPLFLSKSLLGECLSAQGKLQEAEPLLIDGYQGLKARAQTLAVPDRKRLLSDALQRLIAHYESASRPDEVARSRAELEQLQSAEAAK